MTAPGRVVLLNGTASVGKTSIAAAIQMAASTMWVVVAQDDFARNLIPRFVGLTEGAGMPVTPSAGFTFVRVGDGTMTVDVGPVGRRLLRGYRQAVAAVARAGNDVLVDEAKFDDDGLAEWQEALDGLDVTWVRVDCDLTICEARECAKRPSSASRVGAWALRASPRGSAVRCCGLDDRCIPGALRGGRSRSTPIARTIPVCCRPLGRSARNRSSGQLRTGR